MGISGDGGSTYPQVVTLRPGMVSDTAGVARELRAFADRLESGQWGGCDGALVFAFRDGRVEGRALIGGMSYADIALALLDVQDAVVRREL